MKNIWLKRIFACVCAAAMLCQLVLIPDRAVSAEQAPLTFADFGMNDSTASLEGQLWGQLDTYTNVTGLVGQSFEGYITLGFTTAHPLTAAHIFSKEAGGIGIFANGPEQIGIGSYNVDGTKNTTIVSVPISDYGITFAEGEGFSEFKISVKVNTVSGNDVDLLIHLNDQLIFDGTAVGIADILGPKAFIWGFNAPVSIRSVYEAPADITYERVTFENFGLADQTFADGTQKTGRPTTITTLDGLCIVGSLQMSYHGNDVMHSIRFGQSEAPGSTGWNGVGFYAKSESELVLADFSNYNDREIIRVLNIADYNITYAGGMFSEFAFVMKFKSISDTRHMWVDITVNGESFYSGLIADAQDSFGPNIQLWANGGTIRVKSSLEDMEPVIPDGPYRQVSFADFGLADGTFVAGTQKTGRPTDITTLDGICIAGKLQMAYHGNDIQHSIRFGQSEAPGSTCWNGIGFYAKSESELVLANFVNYNNGSVIQVINIADYNITYADGMFSEFEFSIKFRNIPNTRHMWVDVTVNGIALYSGKIVNAQDTFGCNIHLWANDATISIKSVEDETENPPIKQTVTFADFGMNDSAAAIEGQLWGQLAGYTDVNSLAGIAFEGNVTLGFTQAHPLTSAHVFAKEAGGIGVYADGQEKIAFGVYSADGSKNSTIVSVPIADYGIVFTEGVGFSEFKLCVEINAISGNDANLTIKLNNQQIFNGAVAGIKSVLGPKAFIWGFNAPVSIRSAYAALEEGSYQQVTFDDFGLADGTFAADTQKTGRPTAITTFDGVEFKGMLQMQYHGNDVMHSVRFGQSEAPGSTCWNGVGFYAKSETELVFADYANFNDREIIKVLSTADYDITYSDGMFSEFAFAIKFKNIPETQHMWISVTVNGKAFYSGLIAGAQDTFGCNIQIWANGATIGVKSPYATVLEEPNEADFKEVSFIDFGLDNQIVGHQLDGDLPAEYTSMNGLMFAGKLQMELSPNNHNQSVRIGTNATDRVCGIGLYTEAEDKLVLYHYTSAYWGNELAVITPADYGITYADEEGFSEFELKMFFKFVDENNLHLTVKINGITCYNKIVKNVEAAMGTHLFVWGDNALITIKSSDNSVVSVPDPAPVITDEFKQISFADFGFEKTTVDINNNDLNGHGKVMSLDKVVFSDTLHFSEGAGARWFLGGVDSVWAGIVIEPTDSGNLVLSNSKSSTSSWSAITFIPKVAGCKLVGEKVKITMSFEYVDSDGDGEQDDVKFGIWFNDKAYLDRSYYLTNMANDLGGHTLIHVAGDDITVSIDPYYPPLDFCEFGFTKNWAVELGLKNKER